MNGWINHKAAPQVHVILSASFCAKDLLAVALRKADTGFYNAKEKGRNQYCFYSDQLNNKDQASVVFQQQLQHALDKNEQTLIEIICL